MAAALGDLTRRRYERSGRPTTVCPVLLSAWPQVRVLPGAHVSALPLGRAFLLVRVGVSRHGEAPGALWMIKGRVRGRPAVTGFSRVAVVEPLRQVRVPVVVHAASGGRLEDVRGQYGLTGA